MKKIQKSIDLSYELFPLAQKIPGKYRTFHFAFIWERNNLLSYGINDPFYENAKSVYFAKKFGLKHFHHIHAEIDAISKLWGKTKIGSKHDLIVIRLNKNGQLGNSKPCDRCKVILDSLNIKRIYTS